MNVDPTTLPSLRLSQRLEKTLDRLECVTAFLPSDNELIGYLIESGELNAPARQSNGRKDV